MEYNNLIVSKSDKTCTITINREAKLNALNRETLKELSNAIQDSFNDIEVMGIIITGAGEKAFVAGADITEFNNLSIEKGMALAKNGQDIFSFIEKGPKPVIAAINGYALGGGCELAMACHLRVASTNAVFGQPEVKLGLIPGYGGTQRLTQLIGKGKATELMMTAETITAEEALSLGLVNYVVPLESLSEKTEELLKKIISKAPTAITEIIRCVNSFYDHSCNGYDAEVSNFGNCFGTEDFKEGTAAFLEKRKPVFPGN